MLCALYLIFSAWRFATQKSSLNCSIPVFFLNIEDIMGFISNVPIVDDIVIGDTLMDASNFGLSSDGQLISDPRTVEIASEVGIGYSD